MLGLGLELGLKVFLRDGWPGCVFPFERAVEANSPVARQIKPD